MSARRQQIISAIGTRLATIATVNGYLTNGGAAVRVNPDRDTEPTAQGNTLGFIIRESGGTEQPGMVGENFGILELELCAHATALKGSDPQTDAANAWADAMVAIGTDKTFGGLCDEFAHGGHAHHENQGGKRCAVISQSFKINYRTTRWAPATAPPS